MAQDFKPYDYQSAYIDFLGEWAEALAFIEMGLGKTAPTLTWIANVIEEDRAKGWERRFLVLAPPKVVRNVWPNEVRKWKHLNHLRLCALTGEVPATRRKREIAGPYDIVVLNYELVPWLCETYPPGSFPFYGLVMDEVDKFKDVGTKRAKVFRYRAHEFRVRLGLTGCVTPESLANVFGPVYMVTSRPLKEGQLGRKMPMQALLGSSYDDFTRAYFDTDFTGYKLTPKAGAVAAVASKIAPISFIARAKDHLDLPELITNDILFDLPKSARAQYAQFERDFLIEVEKHGWPDPVDESEDDDMAMVHASNAAVLKNKLRQLASGFMYVYRAPTDEEREIMEQKGQKLKPIRETTWIHDAKVNAYRDAVSELMGEQHVAVYGFRAVVERIGFEHVLSSQLSAKKEAALLRAWDNGEVRTLAMHPQSAGHGLNLHEGGAHHMIFLTTPHSYGQYRQTCKRLHRVGTKRTVLLHRLLAANTVEQDVANALADKEGWEQTVIEAMRKRVHGATRKSA